MALTLMVTLALVCFRRAEQCVSRKRQKVGWTVFFLPLAA